MIRDGLIHNFILPSIKHNTAIITQNKFSSDTRFITVLNIHTKQTIWLKYIVVVVRKQIFSSNPTGMWYNCGTFF